MIYKNIFSIFNIRYFYPLICRGISRGAMRRYFHIKITALILDDENVSAIFESMKNSLNLIDLQLTFHLDQADAFKPQNFHSFYIKI